jgi:peptidoglycan/LPS O-acetylase OafA/YrhL
MNTPDDRIWDELGVVWRAAQIDTAVLSQRLLGQLRRESWRRRLATVIGVLAAAIGIFFSVALMRTHQSAWQRSGVIILTGLVILGAIGFWILRSPMAGDTASLIGMLELAASHARRRRREAWALRYLAPVLYLIAIAAVLLAARPHGRYLILDALIGVASSLFAYFGAQRQYLTSRDREARFLHLRRELTDVGS